MKKGKKGRGAKRSGSALWSSMNKAQKKNARKNAKGKRPIELLEHEYIKLNHTIAKRGGTVQ